MTNPSLILEMLFKGQALPIRLVSNIKGSWVQLYVTPFLGILTSHSVMSVSYELKGSLIYCNNTILTRVQYFTIVLYCLARSCVTPRLDYAPCSMFSRYLVLLLL